MAPPTAAAAAASDRTTDAARWQERVLCWNVHVKSAVRISGTTDLSFLLLLLITLLVIDPMAIFFVAFLVMCLSIPILRMKDHVLGFLRFKAILLGLSAVLMLRELYLLVVGRGNDLEQMMISQHGKTFHDWMSILVPTFFVVTTLYLTWQVKVLMHYRRYLQHKAKNGTIPVYYSTTGTVGTVPPPSPAMYLLVPDAAEAPATALDSSDAQTGSSASFANPTYEEVMKSD